MGGWYLKEGTLKPENLQEEKVLKVITKVLDKGIQRTTPYKYIFLAALLDSLGDKLEITFEEVFRSFTRIYFDKYKIYHRSERCSQKQIAVEQELDKYIEQGSFAQLPVDKQRALVKAVQEIGSKYIIGAFYNDSEGTIFTFSKDEKNIILNPVAYECLKKYKESINKINEYRLDRYLEAYFKLQHIDSWSRPLGVSTLIGRKQVDKSMILEGVTGIPKELIRYFALAMEMEQQWMPGQRSIQKIVLEYEEEEYEGELVKRTTGVMALFIKSKELKDKIENSFQRSKEYILTRQVEGRKIAVVVPKELAEYVEFYECEDRKDKYYITLSTDNLMEAEDMTIEKNETTYQSNRVTDKNIKQHITAIHQYIQAKGFTYPYETIANLYLALKTKPFAILAGISGTGKSKIVELFAEAVGATVANGRYQLIAVRPDWSDSTDLLGYRDLNNTFNPGVLTQVLERAAKDPENMYFVCLDEMNLARVEYYFSDFLSVIESRKWQEDCIVTHPILQASMLSHDQAVYERYHTLGIQPNVVVVGTVNMDETTFPFSKKVLDRASTIEFSAVDLNYDFNQEEQQAVAQSLASSFLVSEYVQLSACRAYEDTARRTIEQLIAINKMLQRVQMHFAYRVRDEIVFYMVYNTRFGLMSEEEAMDLQILQKVLPRMSGTTEAMVKVLEELKEWCSGRYPKTVAKLELMIERFDQDGFISYWM